MNGRIDKGEVLRLYEGGETVAEIAERIGCTRQTIYKILKGEKAKEMEYKNSEGYSDPTAYKAIRTDIVPGDVWEVRTLDPEKNNLMLFLQVFDTHAICLLLWDDLSKIPEGCEEKILLRSGAKFTDCSKPQIVFFQRLAKKVGEITINKLIVIRQSVADIILRGFTERAVADGGQKAQEDPQDVLMPLADKIVTEDVKPQEIDANGHETDSAEIAVLRFKATTNEALAGRLLDILEKAVQRG